MKAVIQRVTKASVEVDSKIVGAINKGILILLGVTHEDTKEDVDFLVNKILNLRIFSSENSHFDYSVTDKKAEVLVVSQFTLYGSCKKGRRPDFGAASKPDLANELYQYFIEKCRNGGIKTEAGTFGADMKVELLNDGPVTLIIDSPTNP